MMGVDDELQIAFVDEVNVIRDLRVSLWAEHLSLVEPLPDTVLTSLQDLTTSLGIWRTEWLPAGADQGTWRASNIPPGFAPTERILTQVPDA